MPADSHHLQRKDDVYKPVNKKETDLFRALLI